MREVKIITDSCSDLSKELLEQYNIDYAKMSTVLDGKTSPALLEWSADDVHAFYNTMRDGKRITTSQVMTDEFDRIFRKYLEQGMDIVYIGCSLKQSGSVNTGALVAKKVMEEYPDAKIFCIDSLNACLGEGMLAIEASKYAQQGRSAQEVNDYIISIRKTVREFCTVHTLDYLRRAGRVTASSAFLGNLMGVKPIIIADKVGAQSAFKKVRGRVASIKEIVSLLKEYAENTEEQIIYVGHADCDEEEVNTVVELIKAEIPCKDIFVGYIGPIIGASIGPDAVVVNAFGKEVEFCGKE